MSDVQDRHVKVGEINTRYWAEGSQGLNVVLIHGLGGYAEHWSPSFAFLSARHRVYALDLPGHGLTDKPLDAPYTIEFMAEFVRDFIKTLGIERAHIVGHSLGGAVSAQFAIRQPEMVETLTLVSSAGLGKEADIGTRLLTIPLLGELMMRPNRSGIETFMKNLVYDPSLIDDDLIELNFSMSSQPSAQTTLFKTLRAMSNLMGQKKSVYHIIVNGLTTFAKPLFILWGRNDPVVPVSHGEALAQRKPDARMKIFENCKHLPMLEHTQEFNEALAGWLAA
jgi:4,5:9,10-diseco-3-hydroxy-5,9,17-trioxoandrosta-1(10),2-diene-4-oate hydrolase